MDRTWIFDHVAVSVSRIDFLDPALSGEADVRERGVRVELRPVSSSSTGSIYASVATTLEPATMRIDLLESRPGAADRMHWHPAMTAGEPGPRVFDEQLSADPVGWLAARLREVDGGRDGLGAHADEIAAEAARGLEWAREPWPEVARDERGIAT